MPKSELRLIKNALEYQPKSEIKRIPPGTRGIYVLYQRRGKASARSHHYDFVYIGLAARSIRSRLNIHSRNKRKHWTHFSCFEVWDNISDEEISELEGLFRHLYRYDSKANPFNRQKGYRRLGLVRDRTEEMWPEITP